MYGYWYYSVLRIFGVRTFSECFQKFEIGHPFQVRISDKGVQLQRKVCYVFIDWPKSEFVIQKMTTKSVSNYEEE